MSAPLLRDLVSQGLGLRILVGGDDLRRAIRSVHVVDLERPGHYLLPGELVLTNGLWLDRVAPATWVADVAAAGAAAIGFGVGTPHAAVPPALGEACADHGLPLLEVPEALSFAAIQDAFAARVSRDHALGVRRHLARTRALLADLTDGGGHRALLATLRRETDLDAALIGPGGRVLAAAGAIPDVASATAAERAARRGELPCSIDAHSSAFGAPGGRFLASTLLVRAPLNEISDDARLIIDQVVAYAALEDSRAWAERKAGADAARELLDLARSGDLTDAGFASRVRALGLEPGGPVCVIASLNDLESAAYAAEGAGVPYALARQDATVLLLAAVPDDEHALVARLAALIADGGEDPVLGGGRPAVGASGLRQSLRDALAALALARSRPGGDRVVGHLDVGSHVLLLDLVEPEVRTAFRASVLGPLQRWDAEHASALVETLRAFLQNGGHWRRTAAQLHVHHNTLRHRLGRVEQLTGRDLQATGDRVDFHLALTITDSG